MTVQDIVNRAGRITGILASGETFSGQEAIDALATFNGILQSWSAEGLAMFREERDLTPLVANQQSYTVPNLSLISNVGVVQGSGLTEVEYPVEIINQGQQADIINKNLTSNIPQFVYITRVEEDFVLEFYPIPSIACNMAIYSTKKVSATVHLNDTLLFPIGYNEALTYAVAVDLSIEYQKPLNEMAMMKAVNLKADLMRRNTNPVLMKSDLNDMRPYKPFNIYTGE